MNDPRAIFSAGNPRLQRLWDATSLHELMQCPRKYQLGVLEGWHRQRVPGEVGDANYHLTFGTLIHGAKEAFWIARAGGITGEALIQATLAWTLRASWGWESPDKLKNRRTLVRAVVWWAMDQVADPSVSVAQIAGVPAVEIQLRHALPAETPSGELYELIANIDSIVIFGSEYFGGESKTTRNAMTKSYWSGFDLNVQIDTYDLVLYAKWQETPFAPEGHSYSGMMVEALQTGVQFARWERKIFQRTPAYRTEWLKELIYWIKRAESYAYEGYWPRNRATCKLDGGCPFLSVCKQGTAQTRQKMLEQNWTREVWDPLKRELVPLEPETEK